MITNPQRPDAPDILKGLIAGVAFVLLIIFIITTPLIENSVNLVIPSSGAANAPVNPSEVQTISIDRNATKRE
jgi:biopolymer transport protein ExbD